MQFTTRKPSGKPSFPLVLLSGVEGGGKTWAAVETTSMSAIDRSFFIEIGESQADAYGAVPGADFEIIEHDGTLGNIRAAIQWASQQPAGEGKFNLLIVDSLTEIWQLLQDEAQDEANRRARRKGRKVPEEGVRISMDLWNQIKDTWNGIVGQLRKFPGPVLGTARLELVTAMNDGQPTGEKFWKVQAEKNLPFHAQVVLQAREPRRWTMTKIATTVPELQLQPGGEMSFNEFSVEKLLTTMGIGADSETTTHVETKREGAFDEEAQAEREAEVKRREYVTTQVDHLMVAERAGEIDRLRKAVSYYGNQGDTELRGMAQKCLERLEARQNESAVETVQEVLDATVVEDQ